MKNFSNFSTWFLLLIISIILLTSCGGNNGNSRNPAMITYTLANGTVLIIPVNQLSTTAGSDTSTSISAIGGTPGIEVTYGSSVTTTNPTQNSTHKLDQNMPTVTINPATVVTGQLVTSSINVVTSNFVTSGTYYIEITATYTYNGQLYNQTIGVIPTVVGSSPITMGSLSLSPESLAIDSGDSSSIVLTLNNSVAVSNLSVNLTPESSSISVNPSNCTLSTESNTCIISLIAAKHESGSTQVIATATDYESVASTISILATNIWSWSGGSYYSESHGIYGTKGQASALNAPGARGLSYNWTEPYGNLWLFGGLGLAESGNGLLSDLWKYNVNTQEWTWINGSKQTNQAPVYGTKGIPAPSNTPGARTYSVSWTDSDGNLWLFGGIGYNFEDYLNDLWKYDIATNEWTWVSGESNAFGIPNYGTKGIPSEANIPGARIGCIGWADESNNLWLFGGATSTESQSGFLNDLWKYDIATNEWTWVSGESTTNSPGEYGTKGVASIANIPSSRSEATTFKYRDGNLWLFGGGRVFLGSGPTQNDLWKYNISTNEWTWVSGESTMNSPGEYGTQGVTSPNNMPGARSMALGWRDNSNHLWIMDGVGISESAEPFNSAPPIKTDVWEYNINTNQWTWVNGSNLTNQTGVCGIIGVPNYSNMPGSRFAAMGWSDNSNHLWMLGGAGYSCSQDSYGSLNDLWVYRFN